MLLFQINSQYVKVKYLHVCDLKLKFVLVPFCLLN